MLAQAPVHGPDGGLRGSDGQGASRLHLIYAALTLDRLIAIHAALACQTLGNRLLAAGACFDTIPNSSAGQR